jgi:regulator of sigma E protease
MIDESMDKEQMKQPPQPWEFRTKPAWQRLLIMVGGVVVNFIMAFFIYAMILYTLGQEYVPVKNAVYGYEFCETALKNGFQNGDKIIAVDGVEYEMMSDVVNHIVFDNAKQVTIERNGQIMDLVMPENFTEQFLASNEKKRFAGAIFPTDSLPFTVDFIKPGLPADKAGIQIGDRMMAVNGVETPSASKFMEIMKDNTGKDILLTIYRNGAEQTITLPVTKNGIIGIVSGLQTKRVEYGFWASFPAGVKFGVNTLTNYVKNMKLVFTKEGVKQLGGFIAIGNIFSATWDWFAFWTMTAFLSIILAFMNILPIPALDGGHVLFILFEIITGRKPSDKFLEHAQIVGMILLIGLLLLANGNDVFRLFSK